MIDFKLLEAKPKVHKTFVLALHALLFILFIYTKTFQLEENALDSHLTTK